MRFIAQLAASLLLSVSVGHAETPNDAGIGALGFLEGHWIGGSETFMFEEVWTAPLGDTMTGIARGVRDGQTIVLEFIVIEQTNDGVVMRFKHFNPDYSTWEEDGPIELVMTQTAERDFIFKAEDPAAEVKSIRYFSSDDNALQVDVVSIENGKPDAFTLVFNKATPTGSN